MNLNFSETLQFSGLGVTISTRANRALLRYVHYQFSFFTKFTSFERGYTEGHWRIFPGVTRFGSNL